MSSNSLYRPTPSSLLAALIEAPDLVQAVRELPAASFAGLVRRVGVEDAGEIVALATTEQLVRAFDEDLFQSDGPGARERFDPDRFALWLEVLLEAGDATAAERMAALSEDFLAHALASFLWVLDLDALAVRMSEGGRAAGEVDRALEEALTEEIDGYLLVSKRHEGWDAILALVLALDRDRRDLLVRVLDRLAALAGEASYDLDELATALSREASLAEDAEAEREDRRAKRGHVEPRAAAGFLKLARMPMETDAASAERDATTRAYFRDLEPELSAPRASAARPLERLGLLLEADETETGRPNAPSLPAAAASSGPAAAFLEALSRLRDEDPARFGARMEELAYLANVLAAGASIEGRRPRPSEAAEGALVAVALGAELEAADREIDLAGVAATCTADRLFRKAMSAVASGAAKPPPGFITD